MLSKESIQNIYPLSPMQEGMFFHALYEPNSSAYFEQTSYRLHGSMNIELVEKSLNELFKRYDILRTVFSRKKSEKLLQIVLKERTVHFVYEDISQKKDKESYIIDFREKDRKNVFDLTKDVLMRVAVLKLSDTEYEFIWSHHHILMDGWCIEILISEFSEIYRSLLDGKPAQLPPVVPYSQYIRWLERQDKVRPKHYWRDYVADYNEVASIPRKPGWRKEDAYETQRISVEMDPDITRRLIQFSVDLQVTMNTLVQCIWGILLARYAGKEDVIFGTVVSGRPSEIEGIETMVGLFVNTIPLRIRFKSDTPLVQLLQDLQKNVLASEPYHYYPLADIQANSSQKHNIFDHVTVFQNIPLGERIEGLARSDKEVHFRVTEIKTFAQSNYDLNLLLIPGGNSRFVLRMDFNANAYDPQFITGIGRQMEYLFLQGVELENPAIEELSLLSEEDRKQVLVDFNDTGQEYPGAALIHQLFEEQAERTGDKIAVIRALRCALTYNDLNEKSNQLAHLLRVKGVGPDSIVALMVTPSVEMAVGILGILKAGGAYLPIDPEYPQDRIDYILMDSNTGILVTTRTLQNLSERIIFKKEIIYLEDCKDKKDIHHSSDQFIIQHSDSLAYVIYTSGTTGKPKGVAVEHHGIANFASWRVSFYRFSEDDVMLQLLSYAFDGFAANFYPPLISGGKLVLVPAEKNKDYDFIRETIKKAGVTNATIVPGMYELLLDTPRTEYLTSMRFVTLAGEKTSAQLVETSRKKIPSLQLFNEYGPTETSVGATVNPELSQDNIAVVGKPIGNVRIYILDAAFTPVPVGMQGELCVSGAGVARGYLNRTELTTERFDNDFQDYQDYHDKKEWVEGSHHSSFITHHSALYRTGDLARWLSDGSIEFLGRIDLQVKIRGYRVELEEIESQLSAQEHVKEVVVTAKTDSGGVKYLCAYVVLTNSGTLEQVGMGDMLTQYLSRSMPDYMIPTYFVPLEGFPLTPFGKIDRKALPDPEEVGLAAGATPEYHHPHTVIERELVEIWQAVLGREIVGIDENFFVIGGDSIKSIQVSSRMNQAGYTVEMKDIFNYPTIAELAPYVKKQERVAEQSAVVGTIPLTPIQVRFFQEPITDRHHFNQSVILHSEERLSEEAMRAVFSKIQEHHDALRMTYRINVENGTVIQTNHGLDYPFSLQVFDYQNRPDAEKTLTETAKKIQASFDLDKGPLMKIAIFRLHDGDRLLIVIHHLVVDGVSWRILSQDIGQLNRQYQEGKPLQLPLKTDSFKYWAEQLSQYAVSEAFLKERDYWIQLESCDIPHIEKDFEGGTNYKKDSASCEFLLSAEETERLLTKVNHAFNSEINDILLTALLLGVRETFGHHRLLIALEGHGREEILKDVHINRTVGWFTSFFPILFILPEGSGNGDMVRPVKEVKEALRRIPQKGIGYGIFKYLTTDTNRTGMSFNLAPQIIFNYLGQFGTDLKEIPFTMAKEWAGDDQSPEGERDFELDVSGQVIRRLLHITITFSKKQYKQETVQRLLDNYKAKLLELIDFCSSQQETQPTPADFTYKQLSIDEVDALDASMEEGIKDIYPLSPMQEGMLFHALYDPSSTAYFMQMSYQLQGNIEIPLVKESVNELFKRYDILRTCFIHESLHRPLQVVKKQQVADFHYRDISQSPVHVGDRQWQEAYVEAFKTKDQQRLFDLTKDVLMRLTVIRTEPRTFEFIWSFHHILMDGWCLGILIKEFFDIYRGLLVNNPRSLPPATPYVTYIRWLESQDKDAAESYWTHYLANYDTAVGIPTAGELKSAGDTEYKRGNIKSLLAPDKGQALSTLAARQHVTLNTLLQVAWAIVLGRYNRVRDVVFGAVVSGRSAEIEGVETMIGLFINTIPVRIAYQPDTTLHQLLRKIQDQAIESEPFHHFPLASAQNLTPLRQNLLNHIIVFENYPLVEQLDGMMDRKEPNGGMMDAEVSNTAAVDQTNYDFNLLITPGRSISIEFKYNANIYDASDIHRISGHLLRVLDHFIDDTGAAVDSFSLMSEEEKQQVLVDFNNTTADYPKDVTIHQLFEIQSERAGDRYALCSMGHTMTYNQLNEKSNQLARWLREKGVTAGSIVALMAEPCAEMIIGILAILKAGGGYLPIDPEFPEVRIAYMLADSDTRWLLTQAHLTIGTAFNGETFTLEDENLYTGESSNLEPVSQSTDVVYTIYTSGTTGKPKGVLLNNRNLVNYVHWFSAAAHLASSDRVLLVSSFAYDLGYTAVYPSLVNGAQLHLVAKETYLLPETALNYIMENRITYIKVTPSLFTLMVNSEDFSVEKCSTLRLVVLGGEAINLRDVETIRRICGGIQVMNHYGPTEATIGCVAEMIDFDRFDSYLQLPTIGRPIHNTSIYILDSQQRVQPVGIAGELCISGDCLAGGYLNRPEFTSEKFDQDDQDKKEKTKVLWGPGAIFQKSPWPPEASIYHTGDLACRLPDGRIRFLGRIDQQVKIKGFRIELEEIRSHLVTHPNVEDAAVIDRTNDNGDRYLCAYIVSGNTGEPAPAVNPLRDHLSRLLPEYMIPAFYVPVAEIPLTANGKLDRAALPAPDQNLPTGEAYAAPRNDVETELCSVWENVLGHRPVGIEDNFFMLGGDSIKSIQIVSRMSKAGYKVEMRDLFLNPTISQLAPLVREAGPAADQSTVTGTVPLTPIQEEFFEKSLKHPHHYNMSFMLHSDEGFDPEITRWVFTQIQTHHDALRMTFTRGDNQEIIQTAHGTDYPVFVRVHDLRNRENASEALDAAVHEIQSSINLEEGPIMKLGILRMKDGDRLLIAVHHLVMDGISWRILFEDIEYLYHHYRTHKKDDPPKLPLKTDSFKRWSEQLVQYANSTTFLKEIPYWFQLENTPFVGVIKKDFETGRNRIKDTAVAAIRLDREKTELLLTKVNDAFGTEIDDILLTALGLAVQEQYGHDRLLIALEGHGREDILNDVDISRTVGWFTSRYPVLLDFSHCLPAADDDRLDRQIKEVKETLRQIPHKGIGHGILKYLTAPEHKSDIQFNLRPQISFNYLGQFDVDVEHMSFEPAKESVGYNASPIENNAYELNIHGILAQKQLAISISYSKEQFKEETIEMLIECYKAKLGHVIAYCSERRQKEITPSDLTYSELSIDAVESIDALFD